MALACLLALGIGTLARAAPEPRPPPLRVRTIKPLSPTAGSAVKIKYTGGTRQPVQVQIGDRLADPLRSTPGDLVVRVPPDMPEGRTSLRLVQGSARSPPHDLRIDSVRMRKVLRGLLGGIALFLLGLRILAKGLRGYVGQPVRAALGRWTRTRARGFGFGVALGAFAQSVTSTAGLVVGFVQSRLLTNSAAAAILVGAQLGAASAVLLLPLQITRQSLWIVSAGVAWLAIARHRRQEAAGRIILGVGLLFYGLSLLRGALQPLIGRPDLLPFYDALVGTSAGDVAGRMSAGVVLGALLQGPGAAAGIIIGISETTGILPLRNALQILAATNLGACLTTFILVLPFGARARRIARIHALIGLAFMAICLLLIPGAERLADELIPASASTIVPGKKILMPNLARHAAAAFLTMQGAAAVLVLPGLGLARRLSERRRGEPARAVSPREGERPLSPGEHVRAEISADLASNRDSLDAVLNLLATGERHHAASVEANVARVRTDAQAIIEQLRATRGDEVHRLRDAALALHNLQRTIETLRVLAERGIEKDHVSAMARLGGDVEPLAGPLRALLADAERLSSADGDLDVEVARAHEIQINAREWELRIRLLREVAAADTDTAACMWWSEMLTAFEAVGNAAYRLVEALAAPDEL